MNFKIGDKVKPIKSNQVGQVVGYMEDVTGITYKITSKEVDVANKEVVNGYSFYKEEELEKEKK